MHGFDSARRVWPIKLFQFSRVFSASCSPLKTNYKLGPQGKQLLSRRLSNGIIMISFALMRKY